MFRVQPRVLRTLLGKSKCCLLNSSLEKAKAIQTRTQVSLGSVRTFFMSKRKIEHHQLESDILLKSEASNSLVISRTLMTSQRVLAENTAQVPMEQATETAALNQEKMSASLETEGDKRDTSNTNIENKKGNGGTLSKRAQKRLSRSQRHKELKKQKKAESLQHAQNDDAGYKNEDFGQSSYYFENGLRKVLPYKYVFSTHAKGRWVGRRLYEVLSREFGFDHPDDLTNSFRQGNILVNGVRVRADYVIRDCDYISHRIHRHENAVTGAPIEIIHDSEDVLVINKPSSIPCHPCGRYRFNSVVFILGKDMGYTNLRNIYRLDRLTSGVLVLGKTAKHTKLLEDQVVTRQVKKEYVCRVVGRFPDGRVVVDQPLKALSNKLRLQVVSKSGKASKTSFERLSYNGTSSVVKCWPETGRTHQIRVHLQYLGHPILNDGFYNNPAWGPNNAKGGVYEVPHQKVCEHILQEHHVNLWDGGDNPLYYEKLRLHKAMQNDATEQGDYKHRDTGVTTANGIGETDTTCSVESIDKGVNSSVGQLVSEREKSAQGDNDIRTDNGLDGTDTSSVESNEKDLKRTEGRIASISECDRPAVSSTSQSIISQPGDENLDSRETAQGKKTDVSISGTCGEEEPPSKRSKIDTDVPKSKQESVLLSGGEKVNNMCVASSDQSDPSPALTENDTVDFKTSEPTKLEPSSPSPLHLTESLIATNSQTHSNALHDNGLAPDGGSSLPSVTDDDAKRQIRQMEMDAIDLDCELCKRRPIDPSPKHLVMFLHALKYKGPGWEYETTLPDWADEDWNREDEFML